MKINKEFAFLHFASFIDYLDYNANEYLQIPFDYTSLRSFLWEHGPKKYTPQRHFNYH